MNIDKIITEEINRFINEDVFAEKKQKHPKKDKSKGSKDVVKNGKKLKHGLRTDFDAKKDKETNPNLNNQDSEDIANVIDSPLVNTAAVAHELRPDLTPEGAQSELRKKVKGLKSDSGSTYKLKKKEAFKLNRILSKYM